MLECAAPLSQRGHLAVALGHAPGGHWQSAARPPVRFSEEDPSNNRWIQDATSAVDARMNITMRFRGAELVDFVQQRVKA